MSSLYNLFCLPSRKISTKDASLSIDDACFLVSSGDILLISGTSYSSYFVTSFCASQWSHIAIVYREEGGKPMLFEAIKHDDDSSPNIDVRTGKHSVGVRLIDMKKYLQSFKGNAIAVRRLLTKGTLGIGCLLRKYITREMDLLIRAYSGLPYEHRLLDFFLARYYIVDQTAMTLDTMFCSKLVAWCYISMGLLPSDGVCANQFLPDDFSSTGGLRLCYPKNLPFLGIMADDQSSIIKLSDELYITTKEQTFSRLPSLSTTSRYTYLPYSSESKHSQMIFKDTTPIDHHKR